MREYDRLYKIYYARAERYEGRLDLDREKTEKDLTMDEFYMWSVRAMELRQRYMAGDISAVRLRKLIKELSPSHDSIPPNKIKLLLEVIKMKIHKKEKVDDYYERLIREGYAIKNQYQWISIEDVEKVLKSLGKLSNNIRDTVWCLLNNGFPSLFTNDMDDVKILHDVVFTDYEDRN